MGHPGLSQSSGAARPAGDTKTPAFFLWALHHVTGLVTQLVWGFFIHPPPFSGYRNTSNHLFANTD